MFNLDSVVRVKNGPFKGSDGLIRAICDDGTVLVDFNFKKDIATGSWITVTKLEDVTHEAS